MVLKHLYRFISIKFGILVFRKLEIWIDTHIIVTRICRSIYLPIFKKCWIWRIVRNSFAITYSKLKPDKRLTSESFFERHDLSLSHLKQYNAVSYRLYHAHRWTQHDNVSIFIIICFPLVHSYILSRMPTI